MIDFLQEVGYFVGELLGKILNIPIGSGESPITFGIVLIIIIVIATILKFMFGGKGD